MPIRNRLIVCATSLAVTLAAGLTFAQAALKSPTQVQTALGTLNRVVNHTQRLITAKNYPHLLHENNEFKEGVESLEKGIANEPSDFKARVEPLVKQAQAASQSVADAASQRDDAKLATTHAALADSVKAVLDAFPDNVRPSPQSAAKTHKAD